MYRMDCTSSTIASDLKIFTDILPKLDTCITKYGSIRLRGMIGTIISDTNTLKLRQNIIREVTLDYNLKSKLCGFLRGITSLQKSINSWYDLEYSISDELYFGYGDYGSSFLFNVLNNMKIFSIYIMIMIYVYIYIFLKIWGVDISIKNYFMGIYQGYRLMVTYLTSFIFSESSFTYVLSHLLAIVYTVYQIYSFYAAFGTSSSHHRKCSEFMEEYSDIVSIISTARKIYSHTDQLFKDGNRSIIGNLKRLSRVFNDEVTLGHALVIKQQMESRSDLDRAFEYIGEVDAYMCISDLLYKGYTVPSFIFNFNSSEPVLLVDQVFNPMLKMAQVKNDFSSIDAGLTIITGPNKAGKSTYMRSIFLAVYLSQTLGISSCKNIIMTPFSHLFTYLNIPDIVGRESLFEAELNRIYWFYRALVNLKSGEFTFAIIDELLTGTNPFEGIAASYAICKKISQNRSNISLISTHYHDLCNGDIGAQFLKLTAIKDSSGIYRFPYEVSSGISDQYIAIELLKERGYDNEIIEAALDKLKILIFNF
jgi:hypothetical protein